MESQILKQLLVDLLTDIKSNIPLSYEHNIFINFAINYIGGVDKDMIICKLTPHILELEIDKTNVHSIYDYVTLQTSEKIISINILKNIFEQLDEDNKDIIVKYGIKIQQLCEKWKKKQ